MSLIDKKESYFNKKNIIKGMIVILIIGMITAIGYVKHNTLNNDKENQDNASANVNDVSNSKSEAKSDSENAIENKAQSSNDFSSEYANKFNLDATNNFNLDQLKTYGQPMVIDFGSDSCIPCKEMKPVLESLNKELKGKVIVKFVDVSKNESAAKNLPLKVIPTQFFFDKNGKPYVPKNNQAGFTMYKDKTTGEHLFTTHEGGMDKDSILKVLKEMGVE